MNASKQVRTDLNYALDPDYDTKLPLEVHAEAEAYLDSGDKHFISKRRRTVEVMRINRCDGRPSLEGPKPINIKVEHKTSSAKRASKEERSRVSLPDPVKR